MPYGGPAGGELGPLGIAEEILDPSYYLLGFFFHVLKSTNSEVDMLSKSVVSVPLL